MVPVMAERIVLPKINMVKKKECEQSEHSLESLGYEEAPASVTEIRFLMKHTPHRLQITP